MPVKAEQNRIIRLKGKPRVGDAFTIDGHLYVIEGFLPPETNRFGAEYTPLLVRSLCEVCDRPFTFTTVRSRVKSPRTCEKHTSSSMKSDWLERRKRAKAPAVRPGGYVRGQLVVHEQDVARFTGERSPKGWLKLRYPDGTTEWAPPKQTRTVGGKP